MTRGWVRWSAVWSCALAAVLVWGGAALAAPPEPAPGVEYRVVLRQGSEGQRIEIRRRGAAYLHTLLGEEQVAAIHYDVPSGVATVLDGENVLRLRLGPAEIGGFDAAGMMAGMSDEPVNWATGKTRQIAGTECVEHLDSGSRAGAAVRGNFCVTDEGIVLAISTGGAGEIGRSLEAVTLEIGAQPEALFDMSTHGDVEIFGADAIR